MAEYAAAIAALSYAKETGIEQLRLFSDSQLLVRQVRGEYKVKAAHLVPLFLQVLSLRRELHHFTIEHVPREQNKDADRLANLAIDQRVPLPGWLESNPLKLINGA